MEAYYDKGLVGVFVSLPLTMASQQLLGPNPRRTSITLFGSPSGRYTAQFGAGPAVVDRGINVPLSSLPITLTRAELGSLIEQPLHFIGQSAGIVTGCFETSTP